GFWAGWEGARKLGTMAVSGGGQSTLQRIRAIIDCGATALVCTPTYALHMSSEARKAGMDLAKESNIKITIHAGEPGASIPSTKQMIETSWGAKCFDLLAQPRSALSHSSANREPYTSTKMSLSRRSSTPTQAKRYLK